MTPTQAIALNALSLPNGISSIGLKELTGREAPELVRELRVEGYRIRCEPIAGGFLAYRLVEDSKVVV